MAMSGTIGSVIHGHTMLAALALVATLAVIGYLETRLFPDAPVAAGTSWVLGLLILCFALSGLPVSGWVGVLFIGVWLALGIGGITHFLKRKGNQS